MKLGLTQKYLLCILGKKGKVSAFGIEKYVGLTAAGVLELLQGGVVRLEGKKLSTQYSLPQGKEYLRARISIYRGKAACQLREGHGIFFDELLRIKE